MITVRHFIVGAGTVACAVGIGIMMQKGNSNPPLPRALPAKEAAVIAVPPVPPQPEAPAPEVAISQITLTSAEPVPPMAAPQPRLLPSDPVKLVPARLDEPVAEMPLDTPAPAFDCSIDISARAEAAAMVHLTLSSPCLSEERFTLHHQGMMITGLTDVTGSAEMTVPALSDPAVFIVSFVDGSGAVATTGVSTLDLYDRYVLQWRGESGLHLHAREDGAEYGTPGHVWAESARDMGVAARGEGGFLVRLGDASLPEPLLAEVFSFPSGLAPRVSEVTLSIETEVSRATCGRDIDAQVIRVNGTAKPLVRDISLAMPDCSAEGALLVLKNLFDDLKIARN